MNDWKTWLYSLFAAFIQAAATSITVVVVDPVAFNFGEQWKKTATVALVAGIIGAALYLKDSPLPGYKRTLPFLLAFALLVQGCPFRKPNGETIKPSEVLTAARTAASAPVVTGAACEIIQILKDERDLTDVGARSATRLLDDIQFKLDVIVEGIVSGRWDGETIRLRLDELLKMLDEGVRNGTFNIKNQQKVAQLSSWITFAKTILNDIYVVADALRPIPPELAGVKEQQGLTAGGIAAISGVTVAAVLEINTIRKKVDVKALWQEAKDRASAMHATNASRR